MTSGGDNSLPDIYRREGHCPICEAPAVFTSNHAWYRDHLRCSGCGSIVRERALAMVLKETRPGWRDRVIHESSPGGGGISRKLRQQAKHYTATHYWPSQPMGAIIGEFRNENLEKQTFADNSFDIVISLDVMEHVFRPDLVYQEVYRTLRPRGVYIHTFPIYKAQTEAQIPCAELAEDGSVRHLVDTPEYHGNPIDAKGSLVTHRYGYDIQQKIAAWAPFRVRVMRFWDEHVGVIGEFTEVVVCERTP